MKDLVQETTAGNSKLAAKFDEMAERLQKEIDKGRASRLTNTPKRQREADSARHDADNWERCQKALRALATAHREDAVPPILASVKTKADIFELVRCRLHVEGYYRVWGTDEPVSNTDQAQAMRQLVAQHENAGQAEAEAERQQRRLIERMEADIRFVDIPGFFPTPRPVIETMLDRADIRPGHFVLEPSAGKGDILEAIRERHGGQVKLVACEIVPRLMDIVEAKGFGRAVAGAGPCNCFDLRGTHYDRIVMNPPFERGQDAKHIEHAYSLLNEGGRIVSLVSNSAINQREDGPLRQFLRTVSSCEEYEIPEGSFNGREAFRQTGVRISMLVIDK